jgi:predicted nuclease of predicted toxin-antitoxin system
MKFLLNVNISYRLGMLLVGVGHESRHALDIGLGMATDAEILVAAHLEDEVVITHDLDYGTLLAFSGAAKPSVIIFRMQNVGGSEMFDLLQQHWESIDAALSDGALVIIEPRNLRIRRLPIE